MYDKHGEIGEQGRLASVETVSPSPSPTTPHISLFAGVNCSAFLLGRYHPALVGVVVETLRRCPDALIIFASTVSEPRKLGAVVVGWAVSCVQGLVGGIFAQGVPWGSWQRVGVRSDMLPLAEFCMISSSSSRSRILALSNFRAPSIAIDPCR